MKMNTNTEAAMRIKSNLCSCCADMGNRCGLACPAVKFFRATNGAVESPRKEQ